MLSNEMDVSSPTGLAASIYPLPLNSIGERFPCADPSRAGRLPNSSVPRTRLLQGLLESLTEVEVQGYERLGDLGAQPARPRRLFSSGGGAKNLTWEKIRRTRLADVEFSTAFSYEPAVGAARLASFRLEERKRDERTIGA